MEALATNERTKDFDQLVIRLERNHRCVLHLSRKLTSYKYEPRSYELFIRLRDLRNRFSTLSTEQMELFDKIQHHTMDLETAAVRVDTSVRKFNDLELDMAAYLDESCSH